MGESVNPSGDKRRKVIFSAAHITLHMFKFERETVKRLLIKVKDES